jgi:hypothetical protein
MVTASDREPLPFSGTTATPLLTAFKSASLAARRAAASEAFLPTDSRAPLDSKGHLAILA